MREITCLEIEGFICIAGRVSSTRYPVALTRRNISGRENGGVRAKCVQFTYGLDIYSFSECIQL